MVPSDKRQWTSYYNSGVSNRDKGKEVFVHDDLHTLLFNMCFNVHCYAVEIYVYIMEGFYFLFLYNYFRFLEDGCRRPTSNFQRLTS